MCKFDLFAYLEENNPEACIYRCGYYIVNQYCNVKTILEINDVFYTIYDNMLLKFEMKESNSTQFFDIYLLRSFTNEQITKIGLLTLNLEDLRSDLIDTIMNIENYSIL